MLLLLLLLLLNTTLCSVSGWTGDPRQGGLLSLIQNIRRASCSVAILRKYSTRETRFVSVEACLIER